jgi:hypothetical protein
MSVLPLYSAVTCVYRMSVHGASNAVFHAEVDGKGPFFVLIHCNPDTIFGAFCDIPLASDGKWQNTANAWLFSIRNNGTWTNFKLPIQPNKTAYAINFAKFFALMFGSGKDLFLNLDKLGDSRSSVASTYAIPKEILK